MTIQYEELEKNIAQEIFDRLQKHCFPRPDWVDCVDIEDIFAVFKSYGVTRK